MKLGAEIAIETVGIILDNVKSNTDKDGFFQFSKALVGNRLQKTRN